MAHHKALNLNSSTWTSVTAQTVCRNIIVQEPLLAGTTDVYQASPTDTSVFGSVPAGVPIQFTPTGGTFEVGTVVGKLKLATGSVTFDQIEQ